MRERDELLASWERELQTIQRVLRAYPAERADFRPREGACSATELAAALATAHVAATECILGGARELGPAAVAAPADWTALLCRVEQLQARLVRALRDVSDEQLRAPVRVPVDRGAMADVSRAQLLWLALMDLVRKRGELALHLRLATDDARIPRALPGQGFRRADLQPTG